jgi:hypothetical protein
MEGFTRSDEFLVIGPKLCDCLTALGCDVPSPAKHPTKTEFDIKPHPDFLVAKTNSMERKKLQ